MKQSTKDLLAGLGRLRQRVNAKGNRLYRVELAARHASGMRALGIEGYRKAVVTMGEVTRKVDELRSRME